MPCRYHTCRKLFASLVRAQQACFVAEEVVSSCKPICDATLQSSGGGRLSAQR